MGRLRRARYWVVLLLILLDVAVVSATSSRGWSYVAIVVLRGLTLLACLWAARVAPARLRLAALLVVATVVSLAASRLGAPAGADPGIAARIVNGALVALAPLVVARELWRHPSVTGQTVAGAVCVYLLLGLLFATAYGVAAVASGEPLFRHDGDGTEADRLYFSFITLTSTGYGDFVPGAGPGRALAVMEALLGQLYLVTVIAVLVGRVGPLRRRPDAS
jgi:hypothetical protein